MPRRPALAPAEAGGRRASPAPPLALALVCFGLSGAGALVVETVWMRWLRLLLGATAPAASATLVAFFLGQALGAALAARLARRLARPLRAYGALEMAAFAWALAVPLALRLGEAVLAPVYDGLREHPLALAAARLAAALVATLPAATAFGATLPILAGAVLARAERLGRRGVLLYAVNTAGAAAGTALAAFWLLPTLGVRGAHAAGLAALLLAGTLALASSRRWPGHPPAPEGDAGAGAPPASTGSAAAARPPAAALALAALSGFAAFAGQVVLVQAHALVLDQSVFAFGTVLCAVLVALAAGAFLAAALSARGAPPEACLGLGLAGAALGFVAFPLAFVARTGGLAYLGPAGSWVGYAGDALALAATTAGPALLFAGLVFPALIGLVGRRRADAHAGVALGHLLVANTAGAVAGALAAPWLLLPALGLWGASAAIGLVYAAGACCAPLPGARGARIAARVAFAALVATAVLAAAPLRQPPVAVAAGEHLAHLAVGADGVVAVVRSADDLRVQIDNHYSLGGASEHVREARQGHLPLLLHGAARRVVHVGSATGISAGASLAHPIDRLFVVELVPAVADAARRFFRPWNAGVYDAPRSEVVLDDGRNFLRLTRERFDVVVADLFVPWRAGTAALYTPEHFRAVREHLLPGGLFCQWLPLYQLTEREAQLVIASFLSVFPRAAWVRGDFQARFPIAGLVGFRDAPPDPERIDAAARSLRERGVPDRWMTEPLGLWSLYVGPLAAARVAGLPEHRDDRPVLEFDTARRHAGPPQAPFTGASLVAFESELHAAAGGDALFPDLGAARREAGRAGLLLRTSDVLHAEGRDEAAGRALSGAAERLPAELLSPDRPDPSVLRVWPAGR